MIVLVLLHHLHQGYKQGVTKYNREYGHLHINV